MNILILHGSSDLYGASKILLVTVRILVKKGHRTIVVLTETGPLTKELQNAGAEIIFIRLGILRRKYKSIPGLLNRLSVMRNAYTAIKKLMRNEQIDLVYSNTTAVLAGAFAAKAMKVKHIWHVHEIIEEPVWMYRILGKLLNHYSYKVIVVSEAVKNSWRRYVAVEKMVRIYNGIDYSPYLQGSDKLRKEISASDQQLIIGMVGRVHYWKGQEYFISIAALLAKQYPQAHFVLIGDAFPGYEYLYETLSALIRKEGLSSRVSDLGYRTDVSELIQGFDILVLPSSKPDPFPTVILEAMAAARPVAATVHGGAVEMIDDKITGLLIPVNDAQAAAGSIAELLNNKTVREKMGAAGRKKVLEQYSLEAFERMILNVLE